MSHLLIAVAAAAAVLIPSAASAQDSFSLLLSSAHRDFAAQKDDPFAEVTVDQSQEGEPFRVTSSIGPGTRSGRGNSGAFWTYANGELSFLFNFGHLGPRNYTGPSTSPYSRLSPYTFNNVQSRRRAGQSYRGSNAYGVSATIRVSRYQQDGIAPMSQPRGEHPRRDGESLTMLPQNYYQYFVRTSGADARALTENAVLVIEGTFAKLPEGTLTQCQSEYSSPTVDDPHEEFENICWVGANVTRVAYESNGTVLIEWKEPIISGLRN